jgi:hypothetical protein
MKALSVNFRGSRQSYTSSPKRREGRNYLPSSFLTAFLKQSVAPGSTVYAVGLKSFTGPHEAGFQHVLRSQPLRIDLPFLQDRATPQVEPEARLPFQPMQLSPATVPCCPYLSWCPTMPLSAACVDVSNVRAPSHSSARLPIIRRYVVSTRRVNIS